MHMIGEKMFKDSFVVALKVDGKVLREGKDGSVKVPFGTDYSMLLKNLESKKAVVKISVDGEDVLDGKKLIVNSNSDLELEGYMKNNIASNKFKFIEKTKQIEDFRGNRIDDSLIRVEFTFEKDKPVVQDVIHHHHHRHVHDYWWWRNTYHYPWDTFHYDYPYTSWDSGGSGGSQRGSSSAAISSSNEGNYTVNNQNVSLNNTIFGNDDFNEEGITVKGSVINQQFAQGYTNELEEQSHVITLKIKGFVFDKKKVEIPFFVNDKLICKTCGESNNSTHKFCKNCGTFLEQWENK